MRRVMIVLLSLDVVLTDTSAFNKALKTLTSF